MQQQTHGDVKADLRSLKRPWPCTHERVPSPKTMSHLTQNRYTPNATLLHATPTLCILHKPAGMPVSGNKPLTLRNSPDFPTSLEHITSVPRPISGPAIITLTPLKESTIYTFFAIVHTSNTENDNLPAISGLSFRPDRRIASTGGELTTLFIDTPTPGHGLRKQLLRGGIPAVGTSSHTRATSCATRAVYIACTALRIPDLNIDISIPIPSGFETLLEREQHYATMREGRLAQRISLVDGRKTARFAGLSLLYDGAMQPRESSELVAQTAVKWLRTVTTPERGRVLDLGTGCGAILIFCATQVGCGGVGVDNCAEAVRVAKANVEKYALRNVKIVESDFGKLLGFGLFDVVVSNPPYLTEGEVRRDKMFFKDDPASALIAGTDGLDAYRAIAQSVCGVLKKGGALVLEIGRTRDVMVIRTLFADVGLAFVEVVKDVSGFDRCLVFCNPP